MSKKVEMGRVLSQTCIAPDIYDLRIETKLAKEAHAGQFVGVYPSNASTLLPRPISICEVCRQEKSLRLVYRIAGKGTAEFAGLSAGDEVRLLGVLGNGFPVAEAIGKRVFLMGGGIGIPPMLGLAQKLPGKVTIVAGYRSRDDLFLTKELSINGELFIASDDGSVGTKGTVIDAIKENGIKADVIFACGPKPMLAGVKKLSEEMGVPAYISMEERMACGVGACLGCVCKSSSVDDHSKVKNKRVCVDGPVFLASEVEL